MISSILYDDNHETWDLINEEGLIVDVFKTAAEAKKAQKEYEEIWLDQQLDKDKSDEN